MNFSYYHLNRSIDTPLGEAIYDCRGHPEKNDCCYRVCNYLVVEKRRLRNCNCIIRWIVTNPDITGWLKCDIFKGHCPVIILTCEGDVVDTIGDWERHERRSTLGG